MLKLLRRGNTAIEFALILPVFVTILSGIFEFGWMFFTRSTVVNAARLGCRAGAVVPPDDVPGPQSVAEDAMIEYLQAYNIDCSAGSATVCDIEVTITEVDTTTLGTCDGTWELDTLSCKLEVQYEPIIGLIPLPNQISAGSILLLELDS